MSGHRKEEKDGPERDRFKLTKSKKAQRGLIFRAIAKLGVNGRVASSVAFDSDLIASDFARLN